SGVIAAVRTFFEGVVLHDPRAAVRDVDQIARGGTRTIFNVIADELSSLRPGLDVMPLARFEELRPLNPKQCNMANINAMRARVLAFAIARELAIENTDGTVWRVSRENAVFVVDKTAFLNG